MSMTPAQLTAYNEIKRLFTANFDSYIFAARTSMEDGQTDNYVFSRHGATTDCMGLAQAMQLRVNREANNFFDEPSNEGEPT